MYLAIFGLWPGIPVKQQISFVIIRKPYIHSWAERMIRTAVIFIACVFVFSGCTSNSDWANYHRALRNGETVLIGRIEYQKDWCRVGDRMSCYTIKLKNGTQYPLVFDPVIPNRVTPGEYDVTGHFLGISDKRYEKAFSVRLWSLVK